MSLDPVLLRPEALIEIPEEDENELLYSAAGRVTTLLPDSDPLEEAWFEAWLEEGIFGKAWNKLKHPRWPKGTPGGKGGEFVRVGERFTKDGKLWEVAHIIQGKVYAHEASATYKKAGLLELKPKKGADGGLEVTGLKPVAPNVGHGGKSTYGTSGKGAPIIKPYVEPETHDPKLKLPEGSKIEPEEWKRFGKVDQENYIELMERFGPHNAAQASSLHDAMFKDYDSQVQQIVRSAFSNQYGDSSGQTFSLAGVATSGEFDASAETYVQARSLLNDMAAVLQWDLYNRTRSPDVAIFHKGNQSPAPPSGEPP